MAATRSETGLFGVLLVDKPGGPTSHDVVEEARRALGEPRIGHTGTLDPFASGLLLLCVGAATRLTEYFHGLDKAYVARVRLGVETDTHDREGGVVRESDAWREVGRERVESALDDFTGPIVQEPPAFSAKRVAGERAHRAAREGREPKLEPVEVTVHALHLRAFDPPELTIEARVGTGTYVRGLARDLGGALGCGAHLRHLSRTRIGPFELADALPPEALASGFEEGGTRALGSAWCEPAEALVWLPSRALDDDEARAVGHGSEVEAGAVAPPRWEGPEGTGEDLPVALLHRGRLTAVAERRGGRLQPRKVFAHAA